MHSLIDRDKACIWHPYTSLRSSVPLIPVVSGEGAYLIDDQHNRYIDAISSWWVTLHGHAHPYIASRIYQQALKLEQVIFAGFTHEPAVQLAENLLSYLNGDYSKIFYSDNGSTAVEVAVKMALQYWWNSNSFRKRKLLAFKNAYHGDTFGAMSVSGRGIFTDPFNDKLFEVIFIDTPTEENLADLQSFVKKEKNELAAFIFEPLVQGAGGMLMYEPQLLSELLSTCSENDVLCIADEVMTGFGRTGKAFATHYLTSQPDIICLSKGLTGGTMALGVTACTAKIAAAFDTDDKLKTFFHGHSFTANPIACSAALASLELLQKTECLICIETIAAAHRKFMEALGNIDKVINPRATGTIIAFEVNYGQNQYLNQVSSIITSFMLSRRIYVRPLGNTVYLMPPYCITIQELELVYQAIAECLEAIEK